MTTARLVSSIGKCLLRTFPNRAGCIFTIVAVYSLLCVPFVGPVVRSCCCVDYQVCVYTALFFVFFCDNDGGFGRMKSKLFTYPSEFGPTFFVSYISAGAELEPIIILFAYNNNTESWNSVRCVFHFSFSYFSSSHQVYE